jgi:hypothetical protein
MPFYRALAEKIRQVDERHIIAYEPVSGAVTHKMKCVCRGKGRGREVQE